MKFNIPKLFYIFSDRQYVLWLAHYERLKTNPTAFFTSPDRLPIQYRSGDLWEWIGAYESKAFDVRRGDTDGKLSLYIYSDS